MAAKTVARAASLCHIVNVPGGIMHRCMYVKVAIYPSSAEVSLVVSSGKLWFEANPCPVVAFYLFSQDSFDKTCPLRRSAGC